MKSSSPNSIPIQNNLGSLRLRHQETNEIVLIPSPSKDPNDPLNWSRAFRYYIAIVVCLAVFFCNWLAAGPTVAIVQTTLDFEGGLPTSPDFNSKISKVAYFFTSTALCQGVGMLFWMPLIVKYGRRPIYVASFTLYVVTGFWCGFVSNYGAELAGRIVMGFASGAGECLGPLTITDIFFLHERGAVMATYTAFLSMGVAGGIIIDGLITINHSWRYIYYVACALIGTVTLLVIFTFPETTYKRSEVIMGDDDPEAKHKPNETERAEYDAKAATASSLNREATIESQEVIPQKISYAKSLSLFTKTYTRESLATIFARPLVLIMLPSVLWCSLVFAVTIGFLVAITSNFATAFSETYGFASWQSGLCFVASLIGSLIGIAFGGHVSDWTADWFTRRNGGIREPEMRLPSIFIGGIFAPLSLILYGVGVNNKLHWMVPTLGLGMLNYSIVQATNVAMVYVIDSYRPAVGEVTVAILSFKAAFGFLLSFYTNPWIAEKGYSLAFGQMAAISGTIIVLVFVFYFWGKPIRHYTWNWKIMKRYGHWDSDREVGE